MLTLCLQSGEHLTTLLCLSSTIQLLSPEIVPPNSRVNLLLSNLSRNTITDTLTEYGFLIWSSWHWRFSITLRIPTYIEAAHLLFKVWPLHLLELATGWKNFLSPCLYNSNVSLGSLLWGSACIGTDDFLSVYMLMTGTQPWPAPRWLTYPEIVKAVLWSLCWCWQYMEKLATTASSSWMSAT